MHCSALYCILAYCCHTCCCFACMCVATVSFTIVCLLHPSSLPVLPWVSVFCGLCSLLFLLRLLAFHCYIHSITLVWLYGGLCSTCTTALCSHCLLLPPHLLLLVFCLSPVHSNTVATGGQKRIQGNSRVPFPCQCLMHVQFQWKRMLHVTNEPLSCSSCPNNFCRFCCVVGDNGITVGGEPMSPFKCSLHKATYKSIQLYLHHTDHPRSTN